MQFLATRKKEKEEEDDDDRESVPSAKGSCPTEEGEERIQRNGPHPTLNSARRALSREGPPPDGIQ